MIASFPGRRRGSSRGSTINCVRRRRRMAYCCSMSRAPAQRDGIDAWFESGAGFRASWRSLRKRRPYTAIWSPASWPLNAGCRRNVSSSISTTLLWGGVIGDDGLDGIVLGEGSAAGEAHLALQRYAKQLKERGSHSRRLLQERWQESPRRYFAIIPRWCFAARISPPSWPIGMIRRKTSRRSPLS